MRALDAGADDYVTKPFGMGELLYLITEPGIGYRFEPDGPDPDGHRV